MDRPTNYMIQVEGYLAECWSDWFSGLVIANHSDGKTTLTGALPDQAALLGVLTQIHALNMILISVSRLSSPDQTIHNPDLTGKKP